MMNFETELIGLQMMTKDVSLPMRPFYQVKGCESLYIDFLTAPKEEIRMYAATPSKKRKGPRGGVSDPFPNKLNEMLIAAFEEGLDHVVSWKEHGRSFGIYDPDVFVRDVLPRFFKQSKLTSFQRQLNLYGFIRVTSGPDQGCYYHPMFLRSRPDILSIMIRDRTNPWTKLVEPHEAPSCLSFSDIQPRCPPMVVDRKGDRLCTANEAAPTGIKDCDCASSLTDDLMDLLDPILDVPDDEFSSVFDQVFHPTDPAPSTSHVAPNQDLHRPQRKVVSPTSSDVDDSSDDESTGIFAGQRFHCLPNDEVVLSLEQKRIVSV